MSGARDADLSVALARLATNGRTGRDDEPAGDSEDPLAAVAVFQDLARLCESLQVQAARSAHAAGASWSRIGSALGISRQAAQQRFDPNYSATPSTEPQRRTLGPVARDEEMHHLAAAGSQGWRLVDARHGEHSLEHHGGTWETKRVSIFSPQPLPSTHDGWTAVSTRFPDCFYVRQQTADLDTPAESPHAGPHPSTS